MHLGDLSIHVHRNAKWQACGCVASQANCAEGNPTAVEAVAWRGVERTFNNGCNTCSGPGTLDLAAVTTLNLHHRAPSVLTHDNPTKLVASPHKRAASRQKAHLLLRTSVHGPPLNRLANTVRHSHNGGTRRRRSPRGRARGRQCRSPRDGDVLGIVALVLTTRTSNTGRKAASRAAGTGRSGNRRPCSDRHFVCIDQR